MTVGYYGKSLSRVRIERTRAPMSMSRPVPRGIVYSASLTAFLAAVACGAVLAAVLEFVFQR